MSTIKPSFKTACPAKFTRVLIFYHALVNQPCVSGEINRIIGVANDQIAASDLNGYIRGFIAIPVLHGSDNRGASARSA